MDNNNRPDSIADVFMKTSIRYEFLYVLLACLAGFACSESRNSLKPFEIKDMNDHFRIGGIYSINDGSNSFGIVKILAVDGDAVHLKIYKNRFSARPATVDLSSLSLGSVDDADGFGMGHLPKSRQGFLEWEPMLLTGSLVTEEELEGYTIWKEAGGGVWP